MNPETIAFPTLSESDVDLVAERAEAVKLRDGEPLFEAGVVNVDFFVIRSGQVEVRSPFIADRPIRVHQAGEFVGDLDVLTGRAAMVSAAAKGETSVLRVGPAELREVLCNFPTLGETLIRAFQARRQLLEQDKSAGYRIIGPEESRRASELAELLGKHGIPFRWICSDDDMGVAELKRLGQTDASMPIVDLGARQLVRPGVRELAKAVGLSSTPDRDRYDLAIIGAGPAGLSAAVYAASEGLRTIVIDRIGPGGQIAYTSRLENFLGYPAGLTGVELAARGVLQMLKFGGRLVAPATVTKIESGDDLRPRLTLDDAHTFTADAVLLATGVNWRKLPVKDFDRYDRRNVHYSATATEAGLCVREHVVIVGGGNSAVQAAVFLSQCARSVELVMIEKLGAGLSNYLLERLRQIDHIHIHDESEIAELIGGEKISEVRVKSRVDGSERTLACDKLFVFIGAEPKTDWLPDAVALDDRGYVLTGLEARSSGRWPLNRDPGTLETSMPNVLAAGDVRHGATRRVGFAVGEGAMAVTCVHRCRRELENGTR